MNISPHIKYIGVNDHDITLFEGQYQVKNGMSYNSYLILDDKITIMDTVDAHFTEEWLHNIQTTLGGQKPSFLVVQHMEPDHSASIYHFMQRYPQTILVASAKAFPMLKNFFGTDYPDRRLIVKEGDLLCLGTHSLTFMEAPMVHWPEVIMTYESTSKTLFSADAFGKFGALDVTEEWLSEARRYYIGVVGKYGTQVQRLLEKAAKVDIENICPLHGPILTKDLPYYLNLYRIWSGYEVEQDGILIAYNSIYGNTQKAVDVLNRLLCQNTSAKVILKNLASCDMAEAVSDAFCYGTLILATTTYNGGIFPCMREFITQLLEHNYQNRRVGIIENGSWAPTAAKTIKAMFGNSKNITFLEPTVTIHSALSDESYQKLLLLANNVIQ